MVPASFRTRAAIARTGVVDARMPPLRLVEVAHPLADRRSVSARWVAAIAAAGGLGGSLMAAALVACLSGTPPAAPRFRDTVVDGAVDAALREAPLPSPSPGHLRRITVEQLSGADGGLQRFTRVTARLGPNPALAAPREPTPGRVDAPAPLPPEILAGSSHPPEPVTVSAYAEGPLPTVAAAQPPIGVALNVSTVARQNAPPARLPRVIVARPGDRVSEILTRAGLPPGDATQAETLLTGRGWLSDRTLRGGESLALEAVGTARPVRIRMTAPGAAARLIALADDGRYRAVLSGDVPAASTAPFRSAPFRRQSLRAALASVAADENLDAGLVAEVGRLCGPAVTLDDPVSDADSIDLLFVDGAAGARDLAAVALSIGGRSIRYFRYTADDDHSTDFYDADGRSVTSFLLRKPVPNGRLGDGFGWRVHPVLGDRRFHEGVDYAAPLGSPIAAAGAGTVEKIDQEWGYGRYIRIRHDLGYVTTYAHVAGFPAGMAVGRRVRQGETIAYVGSTGLSTGPHLYYEVKVNGRNVDPLSIRLAGGRILSGQSLADFRERRRGTEAMLSPGQSPEP